MKQRDRRRAGWVLAAFFVIIWTGGLLRTSAAKETVPEKGRVHLDIDSRHKYEGMEQSFSEGYQPVVRDGVLYLVVPFTASGELAGDRLTVSLIFPEGATSVFLPKNYQKTVEKKRYALKGGTMVCVGPADGTEIPGLTDPLGGAEVPGLAEISGGTEMPGQAEQETYLYCMELPLSGTAAGGSCAVTVQAAGYTEGMERVLWKRQLFLSIPEAGTPGGGDKTDTKDPDGDGAGEAPGDKAGGEQNGEKGEGNENGENGEGGETGAAGFGGGEGGGGSALSGGGEELIRQPKILMETAVLPGKEIVAGSEETLKVTFRNRSGSQSLYNLKISVSAEESGLRFSQNSFYFASAAPGEAIQVETGLRAAADAAGGEIPIAFEFEYEDKRGNAIVGRETMALFVRQPVELECLTGEIPGILYASDTLELSVKACNVSRAPVYNVQAGLSAEGLFPDGEVFVGNLEAGAAGEGTLRVYVGTRAMETAGIDPGGSDGEKYGPVEGTVTFRYEDADGKTYEESVPFRTEIKKAQVLSFAVEEPEETNSWWVPGVAAVFAGLVLWILLLLLRLRKKNALLMEAGKR